MAYHSKTSLSLVFEGAKFDMKISIAEHAAVAPGVTFATSSRCSQTTRPGISNGPTNTKLCALRQQTTRAMTSNALVMCQETARIAIPPRSESPCVHRNRSMGRGAGWCEGHAYPLTIGENALLRRPCLFGTSREGSAEGAYLTKVRRPTCSAPASSSPGSPARVVG